MLDPDSYDYAVIRVVPRVDREEFVNAGVILFCLARNFLEARVHVDEARLLALCPELDIELVRRHLEGIVRICEGLPEGGPIAALPPRQRFHWLVSPRSTSLQVSPVHSGLCHQPGDALDNLFQKLVLT